VKRLSEIRQLIYDFIPLPPTTELVERARAGLATGWTDSPLSVCEEVYTEGDTVSL
jgi:hypothetical protein